MASWLVRNCTTGGTGDVIPNFAYSTPETDTWNHLFGNNNTCIMLPNSREFDPSISLDTGYNIAAIQTTLNGSLLPGTYVFTYYAKVANRIWSSGGSISPLHEAVLSIWSTDAPIVTTAPGQNPLPRYTQTANRRKLGEAVVLFNNAWQQYSIHFTVPVGTPVHNNFIIANTGVHTNQTSSIFPVNYQSNVFLDDVSLVRESEFVQLSLPNICAGSTIANLQSYLPAALPTNGVFTATSGTITTTAGVSNYQAPTTTGVYIINYRYTNNLGCLVNASANVNVYTTVPAIPAIVGANKVCEGNTITLTNTNIVEVARWSM